MNKELDLTKPLRIRRDNGTFIKEPVLVGVCFLVAIVIILWWYLK